MSTTDRSETLPETGGDEPTANSFTGDILTNFRRWNRKAVRNPTPFFLEIIIAVLSLILFTGVFGDVGKLALERAGFQDTNYVTFLLPAVLLQATMGSSFTSGMGLVGDLESGMFEKMVVTPMGWTAVFTGKAASELLRIVIQLGAVLVVSLLLGAQIETGVVGVAGILLICLLVGILFMSIANIVGMMTRDEEAVNAASLLFMFPLLFLSPAFIPMSAEIELIATFNPVTYGVDAIRALILDRDVMTVLDVTQFDGIYNTLVPSVTVLIVLNLVFGAVAVSLLSRASSSKAT